METGAESALPRLTPEGCRKRRERLIAKTDADVIVIANPRHIHYFSGFLPRGDTLAGWGPVFLLIFNTSGEARLICHNFAAEAAEAAYVDKRDIWTWYDAAQNPGIEMFPEAASRLKAATAGAAVAGESGWLPAGAVDGDFVDISPAITAQRRSKDSDEMTCIQFALDTCLAGHQAARKELKAGMSELDVFNLLHARMTSFAAYPVKLICDIISGPRTTGGSGPATGRIIGEKDTVILDLNPIVGAYRADYTATIVMDAQPDPRLKDLELALHEAVNAGESRLFPGRKASEVHSAVKECIAKHGFGEGFGHHAGHGLGLGHPEPPYFVPGSDEELVVGDVVTLEPGAYAPSCSGRIEHVYRIEATGPTRLTRHETGFFR